MANRVSSNNNSRKGSNSDMANWTSSKKGSNSNDKKKHEYSHERDMKVRSQNLRIVGVSEDPPYDDMEAALTYFLDEVLGGKVFLPDFFQAHRDVKQKARPRHIILTLDDEQTRDEVLEKVQDALAGSGSKMYAVKDLTPQQLEELRKQKKEQWEQREEQRRQKWQQKEEKRQQQREQRQQQREEQSNNNNNNKETNFDHFASEEEVLKWKALNLRIIGVPESQGEDIYNVLHDFFSQQMHLAVDINHEVEAWREGRHIVIRFCNAESRRRVLDRRGDLFDTPYRITYDLTRAQRQKQQEEWKRRHSTQQQQQSWSRKSSQVK